MHEEAGINKGAAGNAEHQALEHPPSNGLSAPGQQQADVDDDMEDDEVWCFNKLVMCIVYCCRHAGSVGCVNLQRSASLVKQRLSIY